MSDESNRLWPFGLWVALVAIPAIWVACAGLFFATRTYLDWPSPASETALLYSSLAVSVIPLILILVDFIAARGGVIGSKWLNIDFSKAIAEGGLASRDSFALPDNILAEQDRLTDSGGTKMVEAMRRAAASEIVYLDLKDGNAWWVTRLLALCVGVGNRGSPKAIVFVGRKENREKIFLGWGTPSSLLTAILAARPDYRARLQTARVIAHQFAVFGPPFRALMPQVPASLAVPHAQPQAIVLNPAVANRANLFDEDEAAMLAKITIDQLTTPVPSGTPVEFQPNLEEPPDRLTLVRLQELFAPILYQDSVHRSWPNTTQLTRFLESSAPYVALVRNGVYEGMLRSDLGERAVISELFRQSQKQASSRATADALVSRSK